MVWHTHVVSEFISKKKSHWPFNRAPCHFYSFSNILSHCRCFLIYCGGPNSYRNLETEMNWTGAHTDFLVTLLSFRYVLVVYKTYIPHNFPQYIIRSTNTIASLLFSIRSYLSFNTFLAQVLDHSLYPVHGISSNSNLLGQKILRVSRYFHFVRFIAGRQHQ